MIVLLNTLALPLSRHIAEQLASRYGKQGTFLDLHVPQERHFPPAFDDMIRLISFERIHKRVKAEKQAGHVNLVMEGTFSSSQNLRTLRVALSQYDDEIYAFRLPVSPMCLSQMATGSHAETFVKNLHTQWAKALDEGARSGDMGYEMIIDSSDPAEIARRIWDDIHAPVELVEYRESWPAMFAAEKAQLLEALGNHIVTVEHIGSTAIPGMPAKPILDILITVEDLDDTVLCIQPLRELGYAFIDYPQNTDRRFFRKGTPRSHHIHIVAHESTTAQAHLRFRNALRTDAALRREYQQLKQDSMERFKHRRALYGERKGALIRKALTRY